MRAGSCAVAAVRAFVTAGKASSLTVDGLRQKKGEGRRDVVKGNRRKVEVCQVFVN